MCCVIPHAHFVVHLIVTDRWIDKLSMVLVLSPAWRNDETVEITKCCVVVFHFDVLLTPKAYPDKCTGGR